MNVKFGGNPVSDSPRVLSCLNIPFYLNSMDLVITNICRPTMGILATYPSTNESFAIREVRAQKYIHIIVQSYLGHRGNVQLNTRGIMALALVSDRG